MIKKNVKTLCQITAQFLKVEWVDPIGLLKFFVCSDLQIQLRSLEIVEGALIQEKEIYTDSHPGECFPYEGRPIYDKELAWGDFRYTSQIWPSS